MLARHAPSLFTRIDAFEFRLCERLNRTCRQRAVGTLLRLASRLGDGVVWYFLVLMIPVWYGEAGLRPALVMAITGIAGVALYKLLKSRLVRERPYITFDRIRATTAPLDRYSFPSGHTLHAVSLTWLATAHFPELGWVLVPFAALVAVSRVVLGLHYPSDVLAGAAIGAGLALAGLAVG